MSKLETYREKLSCLDSWETYLLRESCLPGPRANLELAFAVALEGSEDQILRLAMLDPKKRLKTPKQNSWRFAA